VVAGVRYPGHQYRLAFLNPASSPVPNIGAEFNERGLVLATVAHRLHTKCAWLNTQNEIATTLVSLVGRC
jgi:hypothetical protein